MTHTEAYEHFRSRYVEELHIKKIKELEQYIEDHYAEIQKELLESFKRLLRKIITMQNQSGKEKIAYIILSSLRTSLMFDKSRCLLSAYNEKWYADQEPVEEEYHAGWLFTFLNQYAHELDIERKKYIGKVTHIDVGKCKMEKFEEYKAYLVALCKKNIDEIVGLADMITIEKSKIFNIRVGEYMDLTESLWLMDHERKNNEDIFTNKSKWAFVYRHYKDLDLSHGDYKTTNMLYTRYERVNFFGSMMGSCTLTGTRFLHCNLEKADLSGSLIRESDFTNSNMKGVILKYVNQESAGDKEKAENPLFINAKFIGADLTNADLSYGNFYKSDFRGAILDNCDFTEANLKRAIMDNKYRNSDRLHVTDEQRGDIIWA